MAGAAAVKRARAGGGSIRDRLSALPDHLLLRVLSFVPAQQVVRTSVLSKRWTDLWRFVPGINLSFSDFRRNSEHEPAVWERMVGFVNNLLMLHRAPCLDAFRLDTIVNGEDRRRHVDRWVRRAIKDNPLMLKISFDRYSSHQLPYLSSSPCRRLTSLHLNGVSLDHSFAERLHSWWPELKDLAFRNCSTLFSGIESDKLENLDVFYCIDQPGDVFTIRAPRLASVSVRLDIPFSLDAGNSLLRASIFWKPGKFSPQRGAILLGSLVNVTSFEWESFEAMAVLDGEFDDVPTFHNLRTLSLEMDFLSLETYLTSISASDVWRFLHKSPNLEKLTLKDFQVVPVVEHVDFPILENLRTLCLDFCDLHDNFQILLHCMLISPNLEKLKITSCKLSDKWAQGKGKAKSKKKTYSQSTNQPRFQCLKLEYAEISCHKEDAGVHELVSFLLNFAAPTITIKVTKPRNFLRA